MFALRMPIVRTLAIPLLDANTQKITAVDEVQRSYTALSLTQFIAAVTDGKLCQQSDLEREKNKILDSMRTEIEYTSPSTFNFARNPALLTFPADESRGLPPLHILSYHLDTQKTENRAEIHVLQCLMVLAWKNGVQLICMGDHNADEANNLHAWEATASVAAAKTPHGSVADFECLSQRVFPRHLFTNRFPYAVQPAHNDDIFAPKQWKLKNQEIGLPPSGILHEAERLAVQTGDIKTKFTFLDQVWSDHRPLAASFEFEVRVASASSPATALQRKSAHDALSQAPTPIKGKHAAAGGGLR